MQLCAGHSIVNSSSMTWSQLAWTPQEKPMQDRYRLSELLHGKYEARCSKHVNSRLQQFISMAICNSVLRIETYYCLWFSTCMYTNQTTIQISRGVHTHNTWTPRNTRRTCAHRQQHWTTRGCQVMLGASLCISSACIYVCVWVCVRAYVRVGVRACVRARECG